MTPILLSSPEFPNKTYQPTVGLYVGISNQNCELQETNDGRGFQHEPKIHIYLPLSQEINLTKKLQHYI